MVANGIGENQSWNTRTGPGPWDFVLSCVGGIPVLRSLKDQTSNPLALRLTRVLNHIGDAISMRERVHLLERRVKELERKSKEHRAARDRDRIRLKRTCASSHRRVLSPAVVHDLLPLRALTIGARAEHADATRYDAWFQEVSTPYREALNCATQPHPHLVRTTVQGLAWWVPVPPSLGDDARERFIAKQRFPYRNNASEMTDSHVSSGGSISAH